MVSGIHGLVDLVSMVILACTNLRRLLASIPGAQEGTYQVNPRQMVVNLPRNLEDDDFAGGTDLVERPLTQATTMSYFIHRLRLSEIIRNFVDRSPLVTSTLGAPSYGDVLEVDIELDRFINSLPSFFRLTGNGCNPKDTNTTTDPALVVSRYFINTIANIQRCKLHLPYMSRGFTDPTYSYSRTTCLKAACLVVQAEVELEEAQVPFGRVRLRSSGFLQCIFIASIALVTDLCLRGISAQPDLRRGPVVQALGILNKASKHSSAAATLLDSLSRTLGTNGLVLGETPDIYQPTFAGSPYTGPGTSLPLPSGSPGWMGLSDAYFNQDVFSSSELSSLGFR